MAGSDDGPGLFQEFVADVLNQHRLCHPLHMLHQGALDQLLCGQIGGGTAGAAALQLKADDALVKPDDLQFASVSKDPICPRSLGT